VPDSVSVARYYTDGNITSSQTLDVLNSYVMAVYDSTYGVEDNPYACDVGGLATLVGCREYRHRLGSMSSANWGLIRSVTLAGSFVKETWITPNMDRSLTMDEVLKFYPSSDFVYMSNLGVNAVRIPVPCDAFANDTNEAMDGEDVIGTLSILLGRAEDAGLGAILSLVCGRTGEDIDVSSLERLIGSAAYYASSHRAAVFGLELPPLAHSSKYETLVRVARTHSHDDLALFVPTDKGRINALEYRGDNVYASLDVGSHASVANVASSDGLSDRLKMFYRELFIHCFHEICTSVSTRMILRLEMSRSKGFCFCFCFWNSMRRDFSLSRSLSPITPHSSSQYDIRCNRRESRLVSYRLVLAPYVFPWSSKILLFFVRISKKRVHQISITSPVYIHVVRSMDRSPIEWLECYRGMPVYVTGFDLSVDDCHLADDVNFMDYGQCDRFNETIHSGWWERHRASLASRQLFAYSLGLGWSFSAWKLYGDDEGDDRRVGGSTMIDSPSRLLCLRDVVEAGLMPSSLVDANDGAACLNGPRDDFAMGDMTFSPTGSPPPDCGYGWWNTTTSQCDYWIPPPPTPAPTIPTPPVDYTTMAMGAAGGAFATLALSWATRKMTGGGRTGGYSPLP
jgi:hypothetical protein